MSAVSVRRLLSTAAVPAAARVVLLFPGQGAQCPGMIASLLNGGPWAAAARSVVEEADAALTTSDAFSSSLLSPSANLSATEVAQPALLVACVAALTSLRAAFGGSLPATPLAAAGHSVGDYAALVSAGGLAISPAVRLLRLRGLLMREAAAARAAAGVGGGKTMLALILSAGAQVDDIFAACAKAEAAGSVMVPDASKSSHLLPVASVAAVNSPTQVVISGDEAPIRGAAEALIEAGVVRRTLPLRVSCAFHSAVVAPVAAPMAAALLAALSSGGDASKAEAEVEAFFRNRPARTATASAAEAEAGRLISLLATNGSPPPALAYRLLANVDARPRSDALAMADALAAGIAAPVLWHASMLAALALEDGSSSVQFIEIGPGSTLAPFARSAIQRVAPSSPLPLTVGTTDEVIAATRAIAMPALS